MARHDKINVKDRVDDNFCDLSLSELNDVPVNEIAACKRITVLDLSSNRLISLGKNFPILTNLVKLDLSRNQIKYLPYDFGLLRNLRHLDLYENCLEHLPLSLGNLNNLRYLDLKGNPLIPTLVEIVGLCMTNKECQDAARNIVPFLAKMQVQAKKTIEKYKSDSGKDDENEVAGPPEIPPIENTKPITESGKSKKSKKKAATKNKKANNNAAAQNNNNSGANNSTNNNANNNNNNNSVNNNIGREVKEKTNSPKPISSKSHNKAKKGTSAGTKKAQTNSSTALTSILTFFLLLGINILIIYMIMFKNPDIADKLVEYIPHQYRDWILTKTEIFRLHVTDWISNFRTPPEEQ